MRRSWIFRTLVLVTLSAPVWFQTSALTHAAEHGFDDHEHHGIPCQLDVLVHEDYVILPDPPVLDPPVASRIERAAPPAMISDCAPPPGQAPPVRAPPHD